jgi:hypothetical protein
MMKFNQLNSREKQVKSNVELLTHLRSSNMPLLFGDLHFLSCNTYTFAYLRTYFDEFTLIVFNKSREPQSILLSDEQLADKNLIAHFGAEIQQQPEGIKIDLAPLSFDVIRNTNEHEKIHKTVCCTFFVNYADILFR